ncbi:MAG: hypothetical protein A2086_13020 [Spirochaetes bacterium GWD1_27_9]|nr:MAG: hypothetical protein A2Y34_18640 [Spirochaetes bacterium GWC1_27_15]OHD43583.1 MAG: hypothetical protein A2086_13020 [Spirochaetes bacterium GWD1_27_9]
MENKKTNYLIGFVLAISLLSFGFSFYTLFKSNNPFVVYADSKNNSSNISYAEEMQKAFRQIAKENIPKVVRIDVTTYPRLGNNQKDKKRPQKTFGSGFIIEQNKKEVFVLTNNHVVAKGDDITIILINEKEFVGTLVGADERSDLAVVKFTSDTVIPISKIGKSSDVQVGDWAIGVGNPFGFDGSMTVGVVSALGRAMYGKTDATDFIQTDAAINPGNSGGPLLNINGEVIGINSWIASQTGSNTGLSFAIPIDTAMIIYDKLKKYSMVEYPWLGVGIKSLTDADFRKSLELTNEYGAYVTEVFKDSPADKAGVKVGDIIIAVDDKTIKDSNELIWTISKYSPGNKVKITYINNNKQKDIVVILDKRPTNNTSSQTKQQSQQLPEINFLGATFSNIDDVAKNKLNLNSNDGIIITKIENNSPAKEYGLLINDVIKKINTTTIKDSSDLESFMKKADQGNIESFYFYITRNGRDLMVGVQK